MSKMNEWNETNWLETRLRSWTPRRRSVRLERRLFRRATPEPRSATLAAWLAPAAACLLFAGLILNPQGAATLSGTPPSGGMVALILSNQSHAAYLPGSFVRTHNQLERFPKPPGGGSLSPTNVIR